MRITVWLKGKAITQEEAKEILGEERFERYKKEAEAGFWEDPLVCQDFISPQGIMEFRFRCS